MCCATRGKGSGLSLPDLPLSASLVSVGKTCLWDLVSSLPTCVQEKSAAHGSPLPSLSFSLSLSVFPFHSASPEPEPREAGSRIGVRQLSEEPREKELLLKHHCSGPCFLFFFFFHTTVVPHYPVSGSIFFFFFFFWGFEVSVLQWLLQKKRC